MAAREALPLLVLLILQSRDRYRGGEGGEEAPPLVEVSPYSGHYIVLLCYTLGK